MNEKVKLIETKYKALLFTFISAFISTLSLNVIYVVADWDKAMAVADSSNKIIISFYKLSQNYGYFTFGSQIICCLVWFFYFSLWKNKILYYDQTATFFSLCFSFVNVLCSSFASLENWDFMFGNTYQILISLLCIAGQGFLVYSLVLLFLANIGHFRTTKLSKSFSTIGRYFSNHTFIFSFFTILLCWLPYLIIYYPARITYDAVNQIAQWFDVIPSTSHHPVLSTWIIGAIISLGRKIGGDNFSLFFYVLVQSILLSAVFSYALLFIHRLANQPVLSKCVLAFFALVPIFPLYSCTIIKDNLSLAAYILFITQSAKLLLYPETLSKKISFETSYVIICIIVSLLRHNILYVILPTLFAFILIYWKNTKVKKHRIISFLLCITCIQLCNLFFNTVLSIPKGSIAEALSIPFQQTARYIDEHENEITATEKNAINSVLNYDIIKEKYNPKLSDPVKATYHGDNESLKEYFSIWFQMLLKHPETYIQATINNSFGYYSITSSIGTKIPQDILEPSSSYNYYIHNLQMNVEHPVELLEGRVFFNNVINSANNLPLIGLFTNCGVYTWALILLAICIWRYKHKTFLLLWLPTFILFLTCIASPVNDNWRYFSPIAASFPVILSMFIFATNTNNINTRGGKNIDG